MAALPPGGANPSNDANDFHAFRSEFIDQNGKIRWWQIDPGKKKARKDTGGIEDATVLEGVDLPDRPPLTEEQKKLVSDYAKVVDKWKKSEVSDNAFALDDTRSVRLSLVQEMSDEGVLHDAGLKDYRKHLAADIADLTPADVKQGEYADVVRYRALMREALLGDDVQVGAEIYDRSISKTQNIIRGAKDVDLEYDLLDIRREAVQEHFDDPRFIAEVGLAKGGSLQDELLFDMDRGDLGAKEAQARSSAVSEAFREKLDGLQPDGLNPNDPGKAVANFIQLQGMASEMIDDHGAVIDFARHTQPFVSKDGKIQGQVQNDRSYYTGLAALDPKPFGKGVATDFLESLSEDKRDLLMGDAGKDPVKLFSVAREKFEQDLAKPDGGGANPAVSFAVMQKAAQRIYEIGPSKINELIAPEDGFSSDPGKDAAAFATFQREEDKKRGRIDEPSLREQGSSAIDAAVAKRMVGENLRSERKVTEKSSTEVTAPDGETLQLAIGQKDRVEIRVLDGSHVALTKWNEGFAKSKHLDEIAKKPGADLSDPAVMSKFLSDEHAQVAFGLSEFKSQFEASGVSSKQFEKLQERESAGDDGKESGGCTRDERMAMAFKMGLGESVMESCGLGEKDFAALASGDLSKREFRERIERAGLSGKKVQEVLGAKPLESLGLTKEKIDQIEKSGDPKAGLRAYRSMAATDASFRLNGIVAPPDNGKSMTKDGRVDAGKASRDHLDQILNKAGIDRSDAGAVNFEFEKSADGKETVASIRLPDGRYLSDTMLQDGYAVPVDGEARNRKEKFAQGAQARRKGLHKHGMPDDDGEWRRDRKCPKLTAMDKKEKLFQNVAVSMAGSPAAARRLLEMKETQIFALPLEEWSNQGNVDREIAAVVKSNPEKVKGIYANNMEILSDLRARNKDGKLTEDEKLAHDRLSVGRRAMAESLVNAGHMTEEQAKADSHKLLSRKAGLSKGFREKMVKATEKTAELAGEGIKKTGRGIKNLTQSAMDFAMDP